MTGPTQPAPRPLPNPGPPPTPAWRYETTQPGPGPKPEGPTGPTPTGPGPQRDECDCGHGDLPQAFHLTPCPKARPLRLPTLLQNLGNASYFLKHAIGFIGRQWDPTSGPRRDDPWDPDGADVYLGGAVADIRSALRELATLATMIPARQSTNSPSLPGGPLNHPSGRSGEGLSPGLDGTRLVARTEGSDGASSPLAGSSHLTRTSPRVSGGRTPGLVDSSAPTDESPTTALTGRGAGVDPDPRPVRIGSDAQEMSGASRIPDEQHSVRPGVGQFPEVATAASFALPWAERWLL